MYEATRWPPSLEPPTESEVHSLVARVLERPARVESELLLHSALCGAFPRAVLHALSSDCAVDDSNRLVSTLLCLPTAWELYEAARHTHVVRALFTQTRFRGERFRLLAWLEGRLPPRASPASAWIVDVLRSDWPGAIGADALFARWMLARFGATTTPNAALCELIGAVSGESAKGLGGVLRAATLYAEEVPAACAELDAIAEHEAGFRCLLEYQGAHRIAAAVARWLWCDRSSLARAAAARRVLVQIMSWARKRVV